MSKESPHSQKPVKFLSNEGETCRFATDLSNTIKTILPNLNYGLLILLSGDLGTGKSVFSRAFLRSYLDNPELNVPSPTFTLVQLYDTDSTAIRHYDLYRMEDPEDIYPLGWDESLEAGNLSLVEWPEKLGNLYDHYKENAIHLKLTEGDSDQRYVHLEEAPHDIAPAIRELFL